RNATPAPTGATPATRGHGLRVLVAAAVVVGFAWFAAAPALAGLGEPVDPRDTTEPEETSTTSTTTTTEADTPGTTEADGPTTTVAPRDGTDEDAATTVDEDDGTSIAALGAVGVVGFILGLLLAAIPLGAALSRRKKAPSPLAPPAPAATPAPIPAPAPGGPAIGPAPSRDSDQVRQQRVVLVEALIALRDKLPSAALGDEAAQALAAAGIHEVRPEGVAFDPAHHRAVHQVPTDDPARHGTIASVERPGYSDGTSLIRPPEVVVAVHGGSS
ncbi:MAG TPA: nucleotide exchange factor GrpE, partial [Iamia sp.]